MVGSGIPERMLAVAETGSFRRCIGDIDARASGTSTSPLQYARSSILTVASLLEANISGNDDEGPKAKQSAEVEEQHATMKQYVAQGVQHVKVKQAVERGGQYATVKKAVNGRDERPVPTEKPDLFYVIDPLAHIAEEAELRRLKEALRLPASDAVNLTKEDMKVLSEANEKLKWMMKTRSRLAVALRKKLEERERLTARMARMNLNRHPLHRVLRCLPGEPSLFV
ncbi:uncharacterized protein EMH_0077560 [Eimeria mitis]|uniref:Uncharacterized protein n=1 Tax=Eimeria mitis TaxID=44415 RepID=U6KE72_9EIME|nr:uncharacterized protein EMH_0077560 [Eimeria mitis]CDJ36320.1 hypothetical protein, conserved [Eimeria mitis]